MEMVQKVGTDQHEVGVQEAKFGELVGMDTSEPGNLESTKVEVFTGSGVSDETVNGTTLSAFMPPELEGWLAGQLSPHTRRAYLTDSRYFMSWLTRQGLDFTELNQAQVEQYRLHLVETFAKTTASRKFTVASKLLSEAVQRALISRNPAIGVKGIRADADTQETPHTALNYGQARELLLSINQATLQGKRDFALIMLLLRTGLRRSECAALQLGDLQQEQGHHLAVVRHGKGDKRRKVKLPVDVVRAIEDYLVATGRKGLAANAPLFVQFRRGDHPQKEGLSGQVIERVVETYAARLDIQLTPHGLRSTFVTLALENGARLHQVQYAVGHADPRTTERYQKRKFNLEDNATDYLRFDLS